LYRAYSPTNYRESKELIERLVKHHPQLRINFVNSAWTGATVNLGPRTVTVKHRDKLNKLTGWCAITALGDGFDPNTGGHLVLWDLKLVIQFPPGATILIPSALLYHSNTSIAEGHKRYSLTQYTSGDLFRWVANGFKGDKEFESTATAGEKIMRAEVDAKRRDDRKIAWEIWNR
jgi:hypothetical protein